MATSVINYTQSNQSGNCQIYKNPSSKNKSQTNTCKDSPSSTKTSLWVHFKHQCKEECMHRIIINYPHNCAKTVISDVSLICWIDFEVNPDLVPLCDMYGNPLKIIEKLPFP